MGQHGRRVLADNAVEIQNIEIKGTRAPSLTMHAASPLFYALEIVQKRFGCFAGGNSSHGIEKIRLVGFSVRRCPHKC